MLLLYYDLYQLEQEGHFYEDINKSYRYQVNLAKKIILELGFKSLNSCET